jgi:hypothetical protein
VAELKTKSCATFLPTLAVWRYRATHLRNHRKILVVDGRVGFTGGMNIREGLLSRQQPETSPPAAPWENNNKYAPSTPAIAPEAPTVGTVDCC